MRLYSMCSFLVLIIGMSLAQIINPYHQLFYKVNYNHYYLSLLIEDLTKI